MACWGGEWNNQVFRGLERDLVRFYVFGLDFKDLL